MRKIILKKYENLLKKKHLRAAISISALSGRRGWYAYTQGCQSEGFLLGFGLIRKSGKLIQKSSDSRESEIRNPKSKKYNKASHFNLFF